MKTVADLVERLRVHHRQTADTPLFNPVFQLSLDLSRDLESGALTIDGLGAMVAELECSGLKSRADRLEALVEPDKADATIAMLVAEEDDFDAFAERWSRPQLHAVFTAHPTFLLAPAQSNAIAAAASDRDGSDDAVCAVSGERPALTLDFEHGEAMRAIAHAQDARDRIAERIFEQAQARWPDRWRELAPVPFRFATWVGYDMDGRTDIKWHTSIAYRLAEKARRLGRYADCLEGIAPGHQLVDQLRRAAAHAGRHATEFEADLSDPAALAAAANGLTSDHPDKLLTLAPVIAQIEAEAEAGPQAVAFRTLAAAMRADGLGMGWIHFRVNASQLHNAIRRRLPEGHAIEIASRGALATLRAMLAEVRPLRANFAALAVESSTAIRQFISMAQILHHVDADAPIRMLIAECEQPATVLAALYFAELFGVADKVDVSPLFETESALEHGGRLLDALLAEPAYQAYARRRGRVAVQTGFSDAGRFVGQIPASLAIERLQGRLAAAMEANGLTEVAALIFDTHGESMGRGAHPSSFADRLEWPLSPWARRRFARAGIALEPEVSFQGGDGYLFFATPELALATLTRIAALSPAQTDVQAPVDPFYRRTDLSLDFYRAIKDHQREHLESGTYSRAITAFGLGMLVETGSRKSRRQSDLAADRDMNLRQIRAIPHNAVLQQLGYPVNVIAGVGSAADGNLEELAGLLRDSARGRQIVRLLRAANALASIKTVAAYGELFNSAYWASRTYRGTEEHLAPACAALAEYLTKDDRNGVFRRLASRLRVDALKLHRLLELVPDDSPLATREQVRREIGVLQSLRLALLQHMFLKAVSIPAFSRANDISRDDVLEMVFTLRIDDALAQLRRAYPAQVARAADFEVDEPGEYPDGEAEGYASIHRDFIDPIAAAQALSLRVSVAIANLFGAHG
ncbi:phosphoenolpyruvate carboxylase [Tsuneonella troitsensis]|uniref:phosphoenolpyruvate carboxylase n=1 Tax=Tsuneonella troitsensis TaxID=292222 RepID=UPI000709478C|nr:phosphoenolpyruvate carboxylase [Tsuneonella troitsensis]